MFTAKAVHNPVATFERADQHETLVYNMGSGFTWLRGKGGVHREWQGRFLTAIDAEKACVADGLAPEAIHYIDEKSW